MVVGPVGVLVGLVVGLVPFCGGCGIPVPVPVGTKVVG